MDSEIIDLTDESKNDLNDDSMFAKIEDSVINLDETTALNAKSVLIDKEILIDKNNKTTNDVIKKMSQVDDDEVNYDNNYHNNYHYNDNELNYDLDYDFDDRYDDDIDIDLNWESIRERTMSNQHNRNDQLNRTASNQLNRTASNQLDREVANQPDVTSQPNGRSDESYKSNENQNGESDQEIFEISEISTQLNRFTNLKRNLVDTSFNREILIGDLDDDDDDQEQRNDQLNRTASNQLDRAVANQPDVTSQPNGHSDESYKSNDNQNGESDQEIFEISTQLNRFTNLKRNLVDTSFNQEILIGDLDDDAMNPFDLNKRKQKRRTKLTDEERQAKQLEKQKEKERKRTERAELNRQKEKSKEKQRRLKEANKYLNLRNASQYCTTVISQSLIDKFLTTDDQLKRTFEEAKLNLEIDRFTSELPILRWKRTVHSRNDTLIADRSVLNLSEILSKEEIEEDQLILVLSKEQFVKMVYKFVLSTGEQPEELFEFNENDPENVSLHSYVERLIDEHKKSILLIIFNLESYFRTLKNREHRDFIQLMNDDQPTNRQKRSNASRSKLPVITRTQVDESILNTNLELMKNDTVVELKLKVKFQFAENQSELINLIYNLSHAMADAPYRRWRNSQEGFDWFVDGDCKTGSVNLKDLPADVNRLWVKHLLLFDKVSLQVAKAIAQKYPNLMALKDKYDSLIDVRDKESLLSNVILNESNRTINLDISKRIFKFLTETNEDEMLV